MKVAMTGATGFIGRHVLTELESRSVAATLVLRPSSATSPSLAKHTIIRMDLHNPPPNSFEQMGAPDVLIHLAWGGLPNYNSLQHFEQELPAQYRYIKELVQSGLKNLIVTGTCFEYGMQCGELDENLKNLANEFKLESAINFIGSKTSSEISNLLEEHEVFVLPSYYENCPVSLLEAQVKGVPCLVTKNGASENVLLPGNGLSVEDDGTGEQLANGLLELLKNMDDYNKEKIRKKGLEAFAPKVFAEKMYEVIKEVLI